MALDVGGKLTPRPVRFTPENDPVTIAQEEGCAQGPVWIRADILPPPGFDSRTVATVYTFYFVSSREQCYYPRFDVMNKGMALGVKCLLKSDLRSSPCWPPLNYELDKELLNQLTKTEVVEPTML